MIAMQSTWSNDTNRCDISHTIVGDTVGNDFSISDSPTSGSVTAGQAGKLLEAGIREGVVH